MASETKSLFFKIPLLLLTLSCSRNRVAASNECLGELTIVNSTQASRPATDSLTVERSSNVTIACWTWCGYVDWSTITPTGRKVQGLGVTMSNCTRNGTCQSFTGKPDCTNVQPGQGNRFKHELSLLANETFYIDCRPQCPFGKENNNLLLEGRTNGLLVHVIDPPEPTQVTPTRSAPVTSSKTSVMCLQDQPSQTMSASPSSSTLALTGTASPTSSFRAQTTSLPSRMDLSTTHASWSPTTKLPEKSNDNIVDQFRASQTVDAVPTETISLLAVIVVSTVLFIIMLVAFFLLLIFYIKAKRRIVELKLHNDEQHTPTKDTELSSQL